MLELETVSSDLPLINDLPVETSEAPVEASTETTTDETVKAPEVEKKEEVSEEAKADQAKAEKRKLKLAEDFAELSKREQKVHQLERNFKEKSAKFQQYEKAKETAKANPIAYLTELTGLTFDEIINTSLSNLDSKPVDPNKKIEDKLAAIEKERADEKAAAEKYKDEYAWNSHLGAVSAFVNNNQDKYEVILSHPDRATSMYKELVDQARELAGGRHLSGDEVIALIDRTEELMTAETQPLFERLSKTKKFAGKIVSEQKTVSEKIETDNSPKTLTNDIASTPSIPSSGKLESHEEAIERIRKLYG